MLVYMQLAAVLVAVEHRQLMAKLPKYRMAIMEVLQTMQVALRSPLIQYAKQQVQVVVAVGVPLGD